MSQLKFWGVVGGVGALVPGLASAGIIVNTVNSGFTRSYSTAIAGQTLSFSNSGTDGPATLEAYNQYYDYSAWLPAYYQYSTNLQGTSDLWITGGPLLPGNASIGSSNGFQPTEAALTELQSGYTTDGSITQGYSYSCDNGKETCYGTNTYYYQDVLYGPFSYSGALLGSGATTGYVGLELDIGGQTHYGWAEFALDSTGGQDLELNLIADAYETTPGESILTGGTTDSTSVPEPGTLALLAAGLAGMTLLRRRRRERV